MEDEGRSMSLYSLIALTHYILHDGIMLFFAAYLLYLLFHCRSATAHVNREANAGRAHEPSCSAWLFLGRSEWGLPSTWLQGIRCLSSRVHVPKYISVSGFSCEFVAGGVPA